MIKITAFIKENDQDKRIGCGVGLTFEEAKADLKRSTPKEPWAVKVTVNVDEKKTSTAIGSDLDEACDDAMKAMSKGIWKPA